MDLMPFDWKNFIYPVTGWDDGGSGKSIEQICWLDECSGNGDRYSLGLSGIFTQSRLRSGTGPTGFLINTSKTQLQIQKIVQLLLFYSV